MLLYSILEGQYCCQLRLVMDGSRSKSGQTLQSEPGMHIGICYVGIHHFSVDILVRNGMQAQISFDSRGATFGITRITENASPNAG